MQSFIWISHRFTNAFKLSLKISLLYLIVFMKLLWSCYSIRFSTFALWVLGVPTQFWTQISRLFPDFF